MKHTGERNVMLASLGKKPRSFPADKNLEENSWPENNNRGDTGHDSEQLGQQWLTSTRPFSQTRTHNNCAFLGETVLVLLGIMAVSATVSFSPIFSFTVAITSSLVLSLSATGMS